MEDNPDKILENSLNFNNSYTFIDSKKNLDKKQKTIFKTKKKKYISKFRSKIYKLKKSFNKIHNRNYKDNILSKIQIHYRNFLVSFINEFIKKVLLEECYATKNLGKILNMNNYLFNKIAYVLKADIKKENMKIAESIRIKDIFSPFVEYCKKYQTKNRNLKIMEKYFK